jgi:hypothetical protein
MPAAPFRPSLSWLASLALLPAVTTGVVGCARARPPVHAVRLRSTADTVITPFGDITDAAWLGGLRWVVIAPQDRAVSVADFGRKSLSRFGGGQARELDQPFGLFREGDSIFVADWLHRRLTSWSLEGRLGGSLPATDALRGALPRARDSAGRWYLELRPLPGPDGRGNLDSASVLRASRDLSHADTIARLAPLDMVEVLSDGRPRLERRLLSGQDRWGVLPDGSVWVARVMQNRVDWTDPSGTTLRGDELPDRVLPVTQNDRDIFLSRFEAGLRPTVSQTPFAAIKPPFDAALAGTDGRVWLVKSRAIGDTLRNYQILDRAGKLDAETHHPGLGRILALGAGYALVGEPFAGGVRLLLFALPNDSARNGA